MVNPRPTATRWWTDDPNVARLLAATFEGGGAKGVAYLGALRATLAQGCWFGAVAGASAGAITATLIAAGLTIDELENQSNIAFTTMKPGSWLDWLVGLRTSFGALDPRKVREWLDALLSEQVARFGMKVEGPVTFAALYEATGIELNVVAADLTRSRQVVFSVWDTPGVQVAHAVLGSSAIPFVFPARHLAVPYEEENQRYTHTIVDGGVWANFPTFVFSDRSFRKYSGRPESIQQDVAVGYLLAEQSQAETVLRNSEFVGLDVAPPAREWAPSPTPPAAAKHGVRSALIRWAGVVFTIVTWPLYLVLWFGAWLSLDRDPRWRGRWPNLGGLKGWVFRLTDESVSTLHSFWFALFAGGVVIFGAASTVRTLINDYLLRLLDHVRIDMAFNRGVDVVVSLVQVVGVVVVIVLVASIAVLLVVLLAANYVLLGPIRQTIYGVAKTYVAGSGAPIWTGVADDDNVIRLPIPPKLTTLSFDRTIPEVEAAAQQAIADAAGVTQRRLQSILASLPRPERAVAIPVAPTYELRAASVVARAASRSRGFFVRLIGVVAFISFVAVAAMVLSPEPPWRTYSLDVRFCRQPSIVDGRCDPASAAAAWAIVTFGPGASGHQTQVTTIGGPADAAGRGGEVAGGAGRVVAIDLGPTCASGTCHVEVDALVDGKLTFRRTLDMVSSVDVR